MNEIAMAPEIDRRTTCDINLRLIALIVPFLLPGCVSIATHENLRRQYKQMAQVNEDLQKQLASVQERELELERSISEQRGKQQSLEREIQDVRIVYDDLVQELKDDIAEGEVRLKKTGEDLQLTLGDKVLFRPGEAVIQPKGKKILNSVAKAFRRSGNHLIRVEGHTDNKPIVGGLRKLYPTNWELSAARAASVVRYLEDQGKIEPALLRLLAYGEHKPVEDNTTPKGRSLNRRVEIYLEPLRAAE